MKHIFEIKNLAIYIDHKMSFGTHNNTTNKSLKLLGFINRSTVDFIHNTVKILYCSVVRSTREYNCIIWNPK